MFCNPPYGRKTVDWVRKAYQESQKPETTVVCLLPSRTDTRWFHDWVLDKAELRFVKGRLKFGDGKNSAPFGSLVAIYGRRTVMDNYMGADLYFQRQKIDAIEVLRRIHDSYELQEEQLDWALKSDGYKDETAEELAEVHKCQAALEQGIDALEREVRSGQQDVKRIAVILDKGALAPTRAHQEDAGLDLYSPNDGAIKPGGSLTIDTGVHVQIPTGYVGMLKSKSGLNVHAGIQSEGVIDAGYTGSVVAKLYNHGERTVGIQRGDKITQLVLMPTITPEVEIVEHFQRTERGNKGFGSTGR